MAYVYILTIFVQESEGRCQTQRKHWDRPTTCSPVGSVPTEMLVYIFSFLVTRPTIDWLAPECTLIQLDLGMQSLVRASHVCRYWREAALNASSLWATFSVGNLPLDRLCLKRSQDAPLRVYISSAASPLFRELATQTHRLKELHTEITWPTTPTTYHLETLYRANHAPVLEYLTVRNRVHSDTAESNTLPIIFCGQFPKLKRLHTIDLAICLTGEYAMRGLTYIRLEGSLVGGACMDVHMLLDFLQMNDAVEELYVSGALFSQTPECDASQSTRPALPLTSLRKLSLRKFHSSDEIAHLLSHLALPSGVAMDLGCSDVNMRCGRLFFPQDLSALDNLQRLTQLRVGFESRYAEQVCGVDDASGSSFSCEVLHKAYSKMHRSDVLRAVANTLPLDLVTELWVSGPPENRVIPEAPTAAWRAMLARMPQLTTLHLEQTRAHRELLAALCMDPEEPDTAMAVPAPRLRSLQFIGDCGLALGSPALRSLAEERASICGGFQEIAIATTQSGDKLRDLCSYLSSYVGSVEFSQSSVGGAMDSFSSTTIPSWQRNLRGRVASL